MHSEKPPLALVTGATGAIGPALIEELLIAGYRVRAFSRSPSRISGIESIVGDVVDPVAVTAAMRDVDFVFHLAAHLHQTGEQKDQSLYERINVEGTRVTVEKAVHAGVRRLVFFSTIAVYGSGDGRLLTEENEPRPTSEYGRSKLAAERIALDAQTQTGEKLSVVLRLAAVYGPGIKGNYATLVRALARHRFIHLGSGSNRRTLVYDRDVARAAVLVARHPVATGRIYNVSDGESHTLQEIIEAICEALDRKVPTLRISSQSSRFLVRRVDALVRHFHIPIASPRDKLEKYLEEVMASSERIRKELGFVAAHHLEDGWKDTIRLMNHRNLL